MFFINTYVFSSENESFLKDLLLETLTQTTFSTTKNPELVLQTPDEQKKYVFKFINCIDPPDLSVTNINFSLILLFSARKTSFDLAKACLKTVKIPNSMQKHGFLLFLAIDPGDLKVDKGFTADAEAFSAENGMFYLEITLGKQRKNVELLQKIMRIRASHLVPPLERNEPFSFDFPLKTPQFYYKRTKNEEINKEIKEFVTKKQNIVPVFDASLVQKEEIQPILQKNIKKTLKNKDSLAILQFEINEKTINVPLKKEDNAFIIAERIERKLDKRFSILQLKNLAFLIEKTVNSYIENLF